jgi:hypothetical protein
VLCLACVEWVTTVSDGRSRSNGVVVGITAEVYIPIIGPTPPIWNISQDSCSTYSGEPGA